MARRSLDDYDDNDPVYTIGRHVHSDGRVEYSSGDVDPPSGRPEPDRENPYSHGQWDGFHQGFGMGGMRGRVQHLQAIKLRRTDFNY